MIIKEAFMKNFGKFHNERIEFQQGINIVYGGNESGKTTLYTFLQGVFFGIRRKRGLASRTDTYSKCLPWENPSWYEGSVLFQAGEKDFRLERNFEKNAREAELYCVTDGEKMSVQEGDLEMLLGGATQRIYENTAAVGQLKSRTKEGLTAELREYLANFQTEGDFRMDPEGAGQLLREKRKEWEKAEREASESKEKALEKLRDRIQYTREEIQNLEERLERLGDGAIRQKERKIADEEAREGLSFGIAAACLFFLLAGGAAVLFFKVSWMILFLILIAEGVLLMGYLGSRRGTDREQRKEEEKIASEEARKKGQRLSYEENLQDKRNQLFNLQEELEELENDNDQILKAEEEARSIALAEKMLEKAAGNLQSRKGNFLKDRVWEILDELTGHKYQGGIIDENFQIRLDTGDKYVELHQISQGTVEQVYFALRMAAGELLCREEELPVLLDETFAMYDDERLMAALKWLYGNRKQVILFTCTNREIQMLEKLKLPWHLVSI